MRATGSVDPLQLHMGRRLLAAAACAALGLLGGAAYLYVVPRQYVAVSTLSVDAQSVPGSPANAENTLDAQAAVIRSSEVLRLADRDRALGDLATMPRGADPVPIVRRGLQVESSPSRRQISVAFASTSREDAIRIVDTVVDAYRSYQSDQRQRRSRELAEAVGTTRTKIEGQLAQARDNLAQFDAAAAPAGGPADAARLASLAEALTRAQLDTFAARRAYDETVATAGPALRGLDDKQLEAELNEATAAAPDSPEMVDQEAGALARQLAELSKTFAENHPTVVRTSQRLRQLRMTQVAGARMRWQAAMAREDALRKSFDAIQKDTTGTAIRTAERGKLFAEVERYQKQVDALDQQLNGILLSTAAGTMSIRVDAPAEVDNPGFPPLPRPTPTLVTAGLIGLAIGGLFALVGDGRGRGSNATVLPSPAKLRTAAGIGESLDMPVLAGVPEAAANEEQGAVAWAARDDAFGPIANAVRTLRRAIEVNGRLPASILLTAAADGQGTTTIACNLAATIAQERRRVLLVDLNFRASRIAALAGLDGTRGLAELLAGGEPIDLIRPTGTPRLDVLPAGATPDDAAALLNSDRFVALLAMLTAAYDHVIFDAPSLARGDDARIVASLCDGTALVARRSIASLRRAAGARDMLLMIGANLLGIVLNRSGDDAALSAAADATRGEREP